MNDDIEFQKFWNQIEDDLGFNDCDMSRSRPYNGQSHTDTGIRGATLIEGVTFRDIHDCFIRAYCLASGGIDPANMPYYDEACKGEKAALCENDLYVLKETPDPMAICQNLCCEIERIMGIYPNVPKLEYKDE